jgi:hypothetical protein
MLRELMQASRLRVKLKIIKFGMGLRVMGNLG